MTAQFRFDVEWMLPTLLMVGAVGLGVIIIVWAKRWLTAQQATPAETTVEDYRVLLEQGLLDPQEFERIRDRLEARPAPPPSAPTVPGQPKAPGPDQPPSLN